ncbi:transmembrane channel-like protein 6 isoform X2 [Homo sapiens]|uniref:transmembrane channel-like protein 6 isoform X2 n=1 Tax=Homo sapiens TaxID=9606 RepID=UPI0005D02E4C|nr:transmembrane channel-like protein 6 isoform X2 [Homo sapiens]XP_047291213.1 transmembrane channel-like protein 6 isoform X2 [Homo sapiens]XP_047291214.1 transmembrane channel-like protein 6 isoform X2 [Homo sapiens]XP_047291215.1 transmembrane channel-like protein 6 isoform X2 [Homo sapiens]XP_047291216.1 transmembrane channel-like protein 6 isoform X2 [Homo sapiens]XP_047291217.1 transmembrane channel-like protein 6 isoform X2 [Homo sapiens]XP_047291219.1 transmembrane channel-like prote|eukprot:XP_011522558.1 transmembrane channel-like protein 6 isoform X2 [Homo sapiens]
MAQPLAFILDVPETPGDQGQGPSPYDESEVHDSFQQLIQEQSQCTAQEGLELQQREREVTGSSQQTLWRPEGTQSTATLRILASMPSRTIGRSRGAIISQYYNRTVQLRCRSSRPLLGNFVRSAWPSLRLYDLELDPTALEEEEKQSLLVKELQSLAVAQRDHMLRGMPLSLAEKRSLREKSRTPRGKWRGQPGSGGVCSCCGRLRYACVLTLLAFNALLLLLLVAFIMGPQVAFPPALPGPAPVCTGLELLTGAGCFTHTVMYYGHYSNATLNQPCGSPLDGSQCTPRVGGLPYNMPLAYLSTVGVSFFITCITLVYSMAHSFGESYRVGSTSGIHAITVFCSWDYKVTQKRASRLQQDNIRTRLKELLAEWQLRHSPRSVCGRLRQAAVLGLVWLLCLGTALGCAVAVHVFSEFMIQSPEAAGQEAVLLVLPLVVGLLNLGAPYLCRVLAALEPHDSPVLEVYVAICRNLILKLAILGTLCYHWLGRRVGVLQGQCWEDFVGQELYRFLVMDFVLMLLDTLFGELVWRIISEKKLKRRRKPEFDIARNVLELIYGQTLTWLGVLFSPLLPAVQIIKLLLVFYVKKTSLLANCQAPRRPWLASHMSTVFLTLLCFPAFLGAAVFLCYAVWQVKPSSTCGPFRTLDTMYEAGRVWVRHLEAAGPRVSWLPWVHRYLMENTFFVFLVSALLLAVIYLNIQVVRGQRKVICLLKEQISNEGEDKIFLINKLHSIYERKEREERSRVGTTEEAAAPPALLTDEQDA